MELSSSLSTTLQLQLPGTLVFDYPSVSAMAEFIHSQLAPAQQADAPAETGVLSSASVTAELAGLSLGGELPDRAPIHIEMVARLPVGYSSGNGASVTGITDGISLVPYGRWNLEAPQVGGIPAPGYQYSRPAMPKPPAPTPLPACRAPGHSRVLATAGSWLTWTSLMPRSSASPGQKPS